MTMSASASQTEKITMKDFIQRSEYWKPTAFVLVQMFFSQACGILVSTFFTVEIFSTSESNLIEAKLATVLLAVIQTIGCIPCSMFVDKYGRKGLLMSSYLGMGIATGGFAVYFYMRDNHMDVLRQHSATGLVPLAVLVLMNLAFAWGVGSVIWIVMSEILPPQIIGHASVVANIIFWGTAFALAQAFQLFKADVPMYMWWGSFSFFNVMGCLFNRKYLPETKGLALAEIQKFYKKPSQEESRRREKA